MREILFYNFTFLLTVLLSPSSVFIKNCSGTCLNFFQISLLTLNYYVTLTKNHNALQAQYAFVLIYFTSLKTGRRYLAGHGNSFENGYENVLAYN